MDVRKIDFKGTKKHRKICGVINSEVVPPHHSLPIPMQPTALYISHIVDATHSSGPQPLAHRVILR